jgi:hypothetical protein
VRELSLSDTAAMRRLSEQYFYAVDHNDGSAMAGCFSENCFYQVNVSPPVEMTGREQIRKTFSEPRRPGLFLASNHALSHHTVSVDDDRVMGVTYAVAHLIMPGDEPRRIVVRGLRYDDEYVVEKGAWYISRRIHNALWQYEVQSTEVGFR